MGSRPPLQGYNHNIRYKNRVYHVQTEDSGLESPHVFTHLFFEGQILKTAKTEYADLVDVPDSDSKVKKMMQDQHKSLMKRLRGGEFDDKIIALFGVVDPDEALMEAPAEAGAPQQAAEQPATAEMGDDTMVDVAAQTQPVGPDTASEPAAPTVSEPVSPTVSEPAGPTVSEPAAPTVSEPAAPTVSEPVEPEAPAAASAAPASEPVGPDTAREPAAPTVSEPAKPTIQEPAKPAAPAAPTPAARPKSPPPQVAPGAALKPESLDDAKPKKAPARRKSYSSDEIPAVVFPRPSARRSPRVQPAPKPVQLKRLGDSQAKVEDTQRIDIRALHGFDRNAAKKEQIVDQGKKDQPSMVYSHVYREKGSSGENAKVERVRSRPKLPQSPNLRQSRVFGQPLPGGSRYPTSEDLSQVSGIPRKSGVYLVPGGPPQRPPAPHPDPVVRARRVPLPARRVPNSPGRYTAPSRTVAPTRKKKDTGSYSTGANKQPERQVVARPVVVVGPSDKQTRGRPSQPPAVRPSQMRPTVMPKAPQPRPSTGKAPAVKPAVPGKRGSSGEQRSVFGSDVISERSLDEVILAYLAEDGGSDEE